VIRNAKVQEGDQPAENPAELLAELEALARELVELIKQKRPDAIIRFNDPQLVAAGLVRKAFGHDDYLHVLFP
ncbi:MAG: DIP1984 family protein, partial [Acidobacteriota bacterium]|nr:DIP1984 family protein [Acidobacteriota bacterium]